MLDDQILHDLKNPLTGITGSIGLFTENLLGPVTKEQQDYLENIDFSARKLTLLLQELTFINNAEQGKATVTKTSFSAAELLKEFAWIKRLADKEKKIIEEKVDGNLNLSADKDLLVMVIEDLLLSAVRQISRESRVILLLKKEKDRLVVEISYPGNSLPQESLAKIFDKDFRANNPKLKALTSPGLGLYFCKLAIEAQGGQSGVEADNEKGTRFYCSWPQS